MSHLSKIEAKIKDIQALEKACKRLGFQFVKNQKTFIWYSYKPGICDHAIKVPGAKYEVGIIKKGNEFELQCDFFDRNLTRKVGKEGGLLKQAYSLEQAKIAAIKKGYSCREKMLDNGSIQLTVAVGG